MFRASAPAMPVGPADPLRAVKFMPEIPAAPEDGCACGNDHRRDNDPLHGHHPIRNSTAVAPGRTVVNAAAQWPDPSGS